MVHQIIVLWCIVNVKRSEINTHELLSVRDTLVRYSYSTSCVLPFWLQQQFKKCYQTLECLDT